MLNWFYYGAGCNVPKTVIRMFAKFNFYIHNCMLIQLKYRTYFIVLY